MSSHLPCRDGDSSFRTREIRSVRQQQNDESGKHMAKRSLQDRRCWAGKTKFPFRDSSGELVYENRRTQPDRRLSGIEVEWLELAYKSGHEPVPVLPLRNPLEG